jgi:hypothetical protein
LYGNSRLGIERAEQSIRGVVSTSELSNEVILAHEKWGTEWWTNLKQQYVDAGKDLIQLARSVPTIYSLAKSIHTRAYAYVNTFRRRVSNRNTSGERGDGQIRAFVVGGEPLDAIQRAIGSKANGTITYITTADGVISSYRASLLRLTNYMINDNYNAYQNVKLHSMETVIEALKKAKID